MELFTIKGLDKLLIEEGLISGLESQNDLLFYDKCNWLISSIARKNYAIESDFGDYANIHSETIRKMLGRGYRTKILEPLEELDIIVINDKYSSDKFSKSYSFKKKAIDKGIAKTKILSGRFTSRYDKYLNDKFEEIYSDPLYRKILDNLSRLKVKGTQGDFLSYVVDPENVNNFKIDRYIAYFNSLFNLNDSSSAKEVFKSNVSFEPRLTQYGRVYHLGASIPRLIRRILITNDNKPLWEVDMSSAQFSLLIMWWANLHNYVGEESKQFQEEYYRNLELVANGGIYKYISSNSEPFRKLRYDDMKQKILSVLNAEYNPGIYNRELKRLFPSFMEWINDIKKDRGYKEVSHLGQNLESAVFVEVYKDLPSDMFSLIIHDCILTTEENIQLVEERLTYRVLSLFTMTFNSKDEIKGLFKVGRVSLNEEDYEAFHAEKYVKEIMEDFNLKTLTDYHNWIENPYSLM